MSSHEPTDAAGKPHGFAFELPKWLIAVTAAILGGAGWGLIEWLSPDKLRWSFPARLVLLAMLGVALLYLVLGLLYLRLWLCSRTRIRFGVRWDSKNNPICSKCFGPLSILRDFAFHCSICEKSIQPNDQGWNITPQAALDRMGKRQEKAKG